MIPFGPDISIDRLMKLYSSGECTPEQVIRGVYERIEQHRAEPIWIHLVPLDEALARASEVQPGPLYGVPFAVKDNMDVAGMPTTAGCPAYAYTAQQTAFAVERLLDAGAILIGKTNMDQFATGLVGTRSPYGACSSVFDSKYISGGSSSGSAVAVARGLVSFSLGTDTAGSGRVPAAFNNIVGLKPTRGVVSTTGVVPACRSLDCVSIFALSCSEAAQVFASLVAFDAEDPYCREWPPCTELVPERLRCGVIREEQLQFFGDRQAEKLYRHTIAALGQLPVEIAPIDFGPFREAAELLYAGPFVAERYAAVGEFVKSYRSLVDPTVASIILGAERYSAANAYESEYRLMALRRRTDEVWAQMDALLLPTAPTIYEIEEINDTPMKLNANLGYYTNFVNLLDLSALAIPAGFRVDGLPFGVTLVAPAFHEHALLHWGSTIQARRAAYVGNRLAQISDFPAYRAPQNLSGWVKLAVVGAHLSGQPLHYQLSERDSRLLATTKTAADYKLYALTNTTPAKPGLARVPGFAGPGIEVEVWLMPEKNFGSFVAAVPPPLSIGSCQLESGEWVKGFVCEPHGIDGMPDITSYRGWRNYLRSK
jgi:allophanate hydrolase